MSKTVGAVRGTTGRQLLLREEKIIKDKTIEHAAAFKNGKILFRAKGGARSVGFTEEQLLKMQGAILTHNHPSWIGKKFKGEGGVFDFYDAPYGTPFSKTDLVLAMTAGLREIRAVSGNRTYVLKLKKGWEFNGFKESDFLNKRNNPDWRRKAKMLSDSFKSDFNLLGRIVGERIDNQILNGTITGYQGTVSHYNYILRTLFKGNKKISYEIQRND